MCVLAGGRPSLCMHDDGREEAVESEYLGKDEHEDEAEEEAGLLHIAADTGVPDDAD